jgi:hypothetical protein
MTAPETATKYIFQLTTSSMTTIKSMSLTKV